MLVWGCSGVLRVAGLQVSAHLRYGWWLAGAATLGCNSPRFACIVLVLQSEPFGGAVLFLCVPGVAALLFGLRSVVLLAGDATRTMGSGVCFVAGSAARTIRFELCRWHWVPIAALLFSGCVV